MQSVSYNMAAMLAGHLHHTTRATLLPNITDYEP